MDGDLSGVKFERYADDIVIHCSSIEQSKEIEVALSDRLTECGLTLHPEKTKVVYCKDGKRKGMYPTKKFTFLGYSFQARTAKNSGNKSLFTGFLPAASPEASKKFRTKIKETRLFKMTHLSLGHLAKELNPRIRGWYNYFQHFYPSALYFQNHWLDRAITSWLRNKFRLRWSTATKLLRQIAKAKPKYFAHWLLRLPGGAVWCESITYGSERGLGWNSPGLLGKLKVKFFWLTRRALSYRATTGSEHGPAPVIAVVARSCCRNEWSEHELNKCKCSNWIAD